MKINLKRLKAERIAKGLTQDEVANRMGWKDRALYAKRENGLVDIGVNEFANIAAILGFSRDELGIFFEDSVPERKLSN
ncbi:helix-turn-helix transcriptional regulator [Streptococcus suis]|uniref:helix-turn-helix domain-containing protein n=1 Tax=Streptococcus suis TaxID=1307 RepID=UPI001924C0CF|nr:helix-turn-helix transcriptional regulator [Streptococcus suis]MBL1124837.1 helix-turn-helix transcriptional regulator [Streptococcus suis]